MANFDKSIIVKLKLNVRGWLKEAAKLDRSSEQFNKSLREMQKVSTAAFGTAERHAASASKKFAKLEEKTKGLQQAVTRHAAATKKQAAALAKLTAKLKKNTTANTAAARVSKSASKAEKNKVASAKKAANELSAIEKKHLAEALRHIDIKHDFAKQANRMRVADEKRTATRLSGLAKNLDKIKVSRANIFFKRIVRLNKEALAAREAAERKSQGVIDGLMKTEFTRRKQFEKDYQRTYKTLKAEGVAQFKRVNKTRRRIEKESAAASKSLMKAREDAEKRSQSNITFLTKRELTRREQFQKEYSSKAKLLSKEREDREKKSQTNITLQTKYELTRREQFQKEYSSKAKLLAKDRENREKRSQDNITLQIKYELNRRKQFEKEYSSKAKLLSKEREDREKRSQANITHNIQMELNRRKQFEKRYRAFERSEIKGANTLAKKRARWGRFTNSLAGGMSNAASSIRQFEIIFDAVFNGKVKEAILSYATFDAGIRKGLGLLPRVEQDFDAVRASLEKLRKEFGVEGVQATDAYYKALSNGLTSGQALKALPIAAKAAIATQAELADVMKVGTDVINATSAEVKDLPAIYNAMTSAVRLGQTTMGEFSTKLGDVLPLSDKLGVKLSTVLSILATMTKQGVSTSIALTRVRRLFIALAAPTKNAAAEFDEFGITAQVAKIKSEGLLPVLELIRQKTGGNTAALKRLAPNMRALLPLVQLLRDGLTSYKKVNDSLVLSTKDLDTAFATNAESIDLVIKRLGQAKDIGFEKLGEDTIRFGSQLGVLDKKIKNTQRRLEFFVRGVGLFGQILGASFLTLGLAVKSMLLVVKEPFMLAQSFIKNTGLLLRILIAKIAGPFVRVLNGVVDVVARIGVSILQFIATSRLAPANIRAVAEEGIVGFSLMRTSVNDATEALETFADTSLNNPFSNFAADLAESKNNISNNLEDYSTLWNPVWETAARMNTEFYGVTRLTQEATAALKEYTKAQNLLRASVILETANPLAFLDRLREEASIAADISFTTIEGMLDVLQALGDKGTDLIKDNASQNLLALRDVEKAKVKAAEKAEKARLKAEKARLKAVKAEAKDRVKREKAELKSIDKLIKAQQKLYDKRSGKDVDLSGLTIDSKELNDLDPMAIAEQFGSFQLSSLRSQQKIFVNENLVLVRKLTESGFRVFFQESEAALAARRGTFKSATEQATDGIVDGLKTLADQISPIVAQLTFESDKLGREALRKSDAALRASPFFNQGAGGLGARAQADFSLRTGAFAGFNAGGSVGLKRYGNGGTTTPLPNTDSVPALLTPGEFVINRESAGAFLPLLQRINRTPSGRVSNDNSSSTQNNTFNFSGGNSISPDQVKRDIIPVIRAQERMGRK